MKTNGKQSAAGATTRRRTITPKAAAAAAIVPAQVVGFEISPYYENMLEMREDKAPLSLKRSHRPRGWL